MYTLKNLKLNEKCIIKEILLDKEQKYFLSSFGIIKGSSIKCVLKSPFSKICAYFVKGTTVALRDDVSSLIIVEVEG